MKADQFVNEISMTKAMAKYLPGSITPEEVYIPDPTGVSELLRIGNVRNHAIHL